VLSTTALTLNRRTPIPLALTGHGDAQCGSGDATRGRRSRSGHRRCSFIIWRAAQHRQVNEGQAQVISQLSVWRGWAGVDCGEQLAEALDRLTEALIERRRDPVMKHPPRANLASVRRKAASSGRSRAPIIELCIDATKRSSLTLP